eukprot:4815186-Pleurochrysis_carterae.AAC.5
MIGITTFGTMRYVLAASMSTPSSHKPGQRGSMLKVVWQTWYAVADCLARFEGEVPNTSACHIALRRLPCALNCAAHCVHANVGANNRLSAQLQLAGIVWLDVSASRRCVRCDRGLATFSQAPMQRSVETETGNLYCSQPLKGAS